MNAPEQYAIRVLAFANGEPCAIAGQYVKVLDFEAHNGLGEGIFTPQASEAMKFGGFIEAFEFWKTQSKTVPLRRDRQPNRPLTCTTIEVVRVD